MAGIEKQIPEFEKLGAKVIAGSADSEENAAATAREVSFPVAFGLTRHDADRLGAWWGDQRNNMQPAEFIVGQNGRIVHSLYASGPVGRMAAEDIARMLTFLASQPAR